jgi:hypothetical protein
MKSTIFWYIKQYSPLKVNRRFGGTYLLHIHSRIRSQRGIRWQTGIFFCLFDPEDGGNMFLRKVGWLSTDYTALFPRIQYFSGVYMFSILGLVSRSWGMEIRGCFPNRCPVQGAVGSYGVRGAIKQSVSRDGYQVSLLVTQATNTVFPPSGWDPSTPLILLLLTRILSAS